MDAEQHLQALQDAGASIGEIAAGAPADVAVPTCPGWDLEALLRHLGKVHRWAATIVRERRLEALAFASFDAQAPAGAGELVAWFQEGHAGLLRTLREAPSDLDCWSFLPAPSPRAFWCRRQAHETVMHLVDVALARGLPADAAPPDFAADGVDELLRGWMRGRRPEAGEERRPSVRVVATDHELDWQVGFPGRRGVTLVPGPEAAQPAGCTVRARAVDLYLLLWNRRSAQALSVEGDVTVLDRWAAARQVQ